MVLDSSAVDHASSISPISNVQVKMEPQRLFPCKRFGFDLKAGKLADNIRVVKESNRRCFVMRIPFERIGLGKDGLHPIRIDVQIQKSNGGISSWRPNNPTPERLILGSDNPADLGWLLFGDKF